ncbi:MAG TPA: hypothetical protein VFK11_04370 [Candidatus Saccharimonadales bacterium]|nr:hypothetical protein [Candidatus Saccharimonadales bacterium]
MVKTQAIATFEGEPLLGEAGMKDIGLLQNPETVNRSKLAYNGMSVGEIIDEEGADPVYTVALKAVLNAERSRGLSLARPGILSMADTNGRSMVELDRMLSASEVAQPVVLLERGIEGYRFDADIFVGVTKPGEGLTPTTSSVQQIAYSGGNRYMADRDSWALPVNPDKTGAFHIDSDTAFGPNDPILSLLAEDKTVAPGLHHDVAHAFELIPEQGNTQWAVEPRNTISYDKDGEIAEVKTALETEHHVVGLAIGHASVEQALQELHEEYLAKPGFEEKEVDEHDRMFDLLTQFALGESGVPARPYMIPAPVGR